MMSLGDKIKVGILLSLCLGGYFFAMQAVYMGIIG